MANRHIKDGHKVCHKKACSRTEALTLVDSGPGSGLAVVMISEIPSIRPFDLQEVHLPTLRILQALLRSVSKPDHLVKGRDP